MEEMEFYRSAGGERRGFNNEPRGLSGRQATDIASSIWRPPHPNPHTLSYLQEAQHSSTAERRLSAVAHGNDSDAARRC